MPPKRKSVSVSSHKSRKAKILRTLESEDQRQARLKANCSRNALSRMTERDEQRQSRLEANRERNAQSRMNETIGQRTARKQNNCSSTALSRLNMNADLKFNGFYYNYNYDYSLHKSVIIGKMDTLCVHCGALKFKNEAPGICCANGKVQLPFLRPPIEPLFSLLSGESSDSKHFLQYIRKYNSIFQMTSFGATKVVKDNYMPTFKIQGQIYHRIGSLLPIPNNQHKFLQIYFMGDDDLQVDQRCGLMPNTKRHIISTLQTFFKNNNALIKLFKTAIENMPTDDYKIVVRADKTPAGEHSRRFNAATINEVAIVMVGEESDKHIP